ncbi:single-stranded-DNA-specific exonuclease RecJ [Tepiditoga spiralis]|uniref:Single-stranded-DNA-specific exonuclease RecJ n=1 Tax=Tepiditoga spiralis TaxID=2108365 RepID=A0A7G1G1C1_9BACT|nr:single-stranded-DNA-specific exonuclease RecJ [Tepiditoga spiralis]BBE29948.1 single-stranded-DNA-specific exonuclease RecJ [Tepiditoga spiralis]
MKSIWRIFWDTNDPNYERNLKVSRSISNGAKVSEFLAKLMVSRGITNTEEAIKFLNPSEKDVIDPFKLKDMDKAVDLLLNILSKKEKIVVFGDYDVDGVTAASTLYLGLRDLGYDVEAYIPSRLEEGYSLNVEAIEEFKNNGFNNIITVDCGITSIVEVKYAKNLGMKVIVTDHHEQQEVLPPADAVINPKRRDTSYPFRGLAGVGVAFKLLLAISSKIKSNFNPYDYIDLVAVGTIADIVPLLSENRYFVKLGIEKLKTNPLPGLNGLLKELKVSNSEIKSNIIAYKVAPKINAAGRMADAVTAFNLLISKDKEEINKYVLALLKLNTKRQAKEKEIYLFALSLMDVNPKLKNDKVIVLSGENWHLGVLGIVASKLSAQFNKPVLMISKEGEFGKGSSRSPQGINLIEIFKRASEKGVFKEFGGHELAAGFTTYSSKIEELRIAVNNAYKEIYGDSKPTLEVSIDSEIDKIWSNFFDDIKKLEPYGYKNPEPTFFIKNMHIENLKFFGTAVESFAGKSRDKDYIMDTIGYGLSQKLKDIRFNGPTSINIDAVGNFREEPAFNSKRTFLKFYLKDLSLIEKNNKYLSLNEFDVNSLLNEEISKVSKIKAIINNLNSKKVAMFLPSKVKYAVIMKKIVESLNKNKKIIIVGSSHVNLKHTYNIISSYISPTIICYNKKSKLSIKNLNEKNIIFITVPSFFKNLKMFTGNKFDFIVDEPFYSVAHPAVKSIKEYSEFRKFLNYKEDNISILGSIYHETLKEFLKVAGYKVLISNINQSNFEIIKEKKKLNEVLKDYLNSYNKKIIVINNRKKQELIKNFIVEKLNIPEETIKIFNEDIEFSKKLMLREKLKKTSSNILITSYSNNGLGMKISDKKPVFILLEPPKTRLELIDLVSNWNVNNYHVNIVLAYDNKFKMRLNYEYAKEYPSQNILKQSFDFIKNNPDLKETDIIKNLFKDDREIGKIVLDELIDSGLILNSSGKYEVLDEFDLKLLHKSIKIKESILDNWIIKETIDFFKDVDTKKFMQMLKTNITEIRR